MLGENGNVSECSGLNQNWDVELNGIRRAKPLFQRLDLEKIIEEEKSLVDGLLEQKIMILVIQLKVVKK